MHHNRGGNILKSVVPWIGKKKIFLVNSVWDMQHRGYGSIISKFDRVFARESISADNMVAHGVSAKKLTIFPDLCVQAPLGYTRQLNDFTNRVGVTNFYYNNQFIRNMHNQIHINHFDWTSFVKSISTAKAMYTGLHHGMYACIKARTPFVVYKHNCCKIQGVLDYFQASDFIEVVKEPGSLVDQMTRCLANVDMYEELFDKVEAHPKFELKDYL